MKKYTTTKNALRPSVSRTHGGHLKHLLLAVIGSLPAHSALIAGWDFQTTTTGGTAAVAQPNSPRAYKANFGSGMFYLDGTNGSSGWLTSNQLGSFGGTGVNAGSVLSTSTIGSSALALIAGASTAANGNMAVFKFSMAGYQSLSISLAAQRTATGFATQLWEYSADGSNYRSIGTLSAGSALGTITGSYSGSGVLGFAAFDGLNDIGDAYVRVTFNGATASTGNNRIDNIQFNATEMPVTANSVPEPGCPMLVAVGAAVALSMRSRRPS
jgi:hypothetical protein